jgi:hypothetical protein
MSTVSNEVQSDLAIICQCLAEHRPIDPAVLQRVRERGEIARLELAKLGTVKIADQLIRETRDECDMF